MGNTTNRRKVSCIRFYVSDCEVHVRRNAIVLFVFLLFFMAQYAWADLAAIHADRLPQEVAVLSALDDAKQLEPYSHSWNSNWRFEIAKKDVATRLGKDLGFLTAALKNHPDNAELLLLTGLVARYAYNLDVKGSHETALSVLEQAQKLAPTDVRAPWFRATANCQTEKFVTGAEEFLSIENSHDGEQLPVGFWLDYMECALIVNMPAHVLRAADHLDKLDAPTSEMRRFFPDVARKRFDPFDPKKVYQTKEVWYSTAAGEDWDYTCTTCGLRFRSRKEWSIERLEVTEGSGVAVIGTGPYQATVDKLLPNILVLIQQPKGNETLEEYSKKFMKDGSFEPYTPVRCPAAACIAMKAVQPGMYKEDGDGHGRVVLFERNQPEFPGLIFETPHEIRNPDGKEVQVYRPSQTQQRIPGKLFYIVLLDAAASIEEPAMKDFDFFLENLTVE
jgi:hypothetical protein